MPIRAGVAVWSPDDSNAEQKNLTKVSYLTENMLNMIDIV
jgi:hypothetical protein